MVARENLRFCIKDLAKNKAIARNSSTSDEISCFLSTSNTFDGEVIRKNKSFKRGSRPEEVCLVSNGVKSSKGKNGKYCGVYYTTKSQSKDSDAPKTKKSWKGKSRNRSKVNYKPKVINDFEQDEEILKLAIKEVEFLKPMLQKNLKDLGAIKQTLEHMKRHCHEECVGDLMKEVHESVDEIHEDVRASNKNLQFKIEKMCVFKNKLAFLSENVKNSSKEFWDEVKRNKRRCERKFVTQVKNNASKDTTSEFSYSINENELQGEDLQHDYHTYIDSMHEGWNKIDLLGVFGRKFDLDQQKVVVKQKWQPKPRNQRRFQNWNQNRNNNLPVPVKKDIMLDEEVEVIANDSISSIDKMLVKRLWEKTHGGCCGDFEYIFKHHKTDIFDSIKDNLDIEGANGKKRRKLGMAQMAMNPNYVFKEASLTPQVMESMSAIYPHKVNRASYEDNKEVEFIYMAENTRGQGYEDEESGMFRTNIGRSILNQGRSFLSAATEPLMQITQSTTESVEEKESKDSSINKKPAAKEGSPSREESNDKNTDLTSNSVTSDTLGRLLNTEGTQGSITINQKKILTELGESGSVLDGSIAIKQEEDTDQSFQIQYPKGMVTVSTADVRTINNMESLYLPSQDTFDKTNNVGHQELCSRT